MANSASAQAWEEVNFDGRKYVTLRSFCDFYGFDYSLASTSTNFSTKNKSYEFRIPRGDSREVFLNGVHYWLSFPISRNDKDWLISQVDVIELFDPILRPRSIADRAPVRGVVIDPGHGGGDNGATSHIGTYEKNYTLDTAFRLEKLLQADGLNTVITRRSDIFITLEDRVNIASRYHDYIFVSLHYNFATQSAHGLETYVMTPRGAGSTDAEGHVRLSDNQRLPGNTHDSLNILLGHEIHRQIIEINANDHEADRGLKRARFVVLKDNTLPAVLVEGGFLTNHMEALVVDRPVYRQTLAEAIEKGIKNYMLDMKNDSDLAPIFSEPPTAGRLKIPPSPPSESSTPSTTPGPTISTVPPLAHETPPVTTPVTPPIRSKPEQSESTVTIYPTEPNTASPPEPPPSPPSTSTPSQPNPVKGAPVIP